MSLFETLQEDEIHYFCYRYETIEYLEKIFNRNIEYEISILTDYVLCAMNNKIYDLMYYTNENIIGIVIKITKNELNQLIKIMNNDIQKYNLKEFNLKEYNIYVLYFNNQTTKISSYILTLDYINKNDNNLQNDILVYIDDNKENMFIQRYQLIQNCKNIINKKYKDGDILNYTYVNNISEYIHLYYIKNYSIELLFYWTPKGC